MSILVYNNAKQCCQILLSALEVLQIPVGAIDTLLALLCTRMQIVVKDCNFIHKKWKLCEVPLKKLLATVQFTILGSSVAAFYFFKLKFNYGLV